MILCRLSDLALMSVVEDSFSPPSGFSLFTAPEGFEWEDQSLWKMNETHTDIVLKAGEEFDAATEQLVSERRSSLIIKHAGPSVNPITLGNLEGATDILAFFMNKLINGETLSSEETDTWNSFYSKVSPYFKITLTDIPNEEDGLASAKAAARQSEIDMKNDPDWNI